MSLVTDIIMVFNLAEGLRDACVIAPDEDAVVRSLNEWLIEHGHAPLKCMSKAGGGTKVMTSAVYGGGFSYLDVPTLLLEIESIVWFEPNAVQVLIKEPNEPRFSVYRLSNGKLKKVISQSEDDEIS